MFADDTTIMSATKGWLQKPMDYSALSEDKGQ